MRELFHLTFVSALTLFAAFYASDHLATAIVFALVVLTVTSDRQAARR